MLARELTLLLNEADAVGEYSFANRKYCLGGQVVRLHQNPSLEVGPNDIVIVGVNSLTSDIVRNELLGLAAISYKKGRIIDAGNLPDSLTLAQQYLAIEEIAYNIAKANATLILIGINQELTVFVYKGFSQHHQFIRLGLIDNRIDLHFDAQDFHAGNYMNRLLDEPYEKLLDVCFLGVQGYFNPPQIIERVQRRKHDVVRLGNLRGNPAEVEPVLKDTHMVSIDLCSVRASDAPDTTHPTPNGLYAEEICLLARFTGLGQENKFLGVFGLSPSIQSNRLTAKLAAQVVWHYLEAVAHRKTENPLRNTPYNKKYVVDVDVEGIVMTFYRNELTGSWWFEVPISTRHKVQRGKLLVRCGPNDYIMASRKDIPPRWLRWFQKAQKI